MRSKRKYSPLVLVWIALTSAAFAFPQFFFFIFFSAAMIDPLFCKQCIYTLFTDPQTLLFINFFIKNKFYSTIYIFKNYFTTVFSVFSFQFQQNKFYPNRPLVNLRERDTSYMHERERPLALPKGERHLEYSCFSYFIWIILCLLYWETMWIIKFVYSLHLLNMETIL